MKRILKKKGFWIALIIALVFVYLAFGGSGREEEIIGGADGPTAIFVAEEEESEPFAVMPANPVEMTGETISVYNWGDYIDSDVIDIFEAETGIRVIYETFETNEDMYAKIAMGGSSYDVIVPSDYMIERMIQEELLQPINWNNVPNVKNIDPRFTHESYDPEFKYSVPYTWGTMGLLYNTETVLQAPDSWDILLDEEYRMDMFMLNAPRDTMAIALVMSGHDLNSIDAADLADAKKLLIDQKPLVLAYVVDEVKDKMIAG
ncbi:MAG: extracellular solute-binding protein, partial [Clostridia bacterium]|nr:extracellular solute-binding protein [Clostridia bacterium]